MEANPLVLTNWAFYTAAYIQIGNPLMHISFVLEDTADLPCNQCSIINAVCFLL